MSSTAEMHVGQPRSRVDGPAKVTGQARYAAEFNADGLLHGYIVSSITARGRIRSINSVAAEQLPGVVRVFTHNNRPRTAWRSAKYQDEVAPPGTPFRPLYDDKVHFSGQPVALVVATDFATARQAAAMIEVQIEPTVPHTDLELARHESYVPPKKRAGIPPPPPPRGDAEQGLGASDVRVRGEYRIPPEHHNPMEPHATTVMWNGDGSLTVHDKTQGVQNSATYIQNVFGLSEDEVRVVTPFVGGAFGSGLRPQHQLFLAVMAALELERSVRVELTRDQMFTFGYRPMTINTIDIGARQDGTLQAIRHHAVAGTSRFEDYQEAVVNWSGLLYHCANVALTYELAKIDTNTPCDMRAPGATLGVFALESAVDELAHALRMDPIELRLKNYAERDENEDKPFTSKELRAAFRLGAERFGWERRIAQPRANKDGRELVGLGVAAGVWEAMMMATTARATLRADGSLEVSTATSDIGTGTYTILTQLAAEAFSMPLERVSVRIGDSSLPKSPVEGGSWTAASAGAAVQSACRSLQELLLARARGIDNSALGNADRAHVVFDESGIALANEPSRFVSYAEICRAAGAEEMSAEETASPDKAVQAEYAAYTHSAVFAEVRVDQELGVVRVTRIVNAVAAGRILNPKTARSQIIGGVVFGIGMALEEETLTDHRYGRFMNRNLAEYHIPVNADIPAIDVIFVDETDDKVSPLGVKGLGEIGIVGTAAAIANAVFNATGKRVRNLPITLDKLLT